MKTTGPWTFRAAKLNSLVIPDTIEILESRAFDSCPNLKEVVIPDSVYSIENYVFTNSPMLSSVTFGKRTH